MAAPLDLTVGDVAIGSSGADAGNTSSVTISLGSKNAASGSSSIGEIGTVKKIVIAAVCLFVFYAFYKGGK